MDMKFEEEYLSIDDIEDLQKPIYVFKEPSSIEGFLEFIRTAPETLIFDKELNKYIERKKTMYIKTLNIKIDEKIDKLFENTRNLGATEEKPALVYNLVVHVAVPTILKDKEHAESFMWSLRNYLIEKIYERESMYFLEVPFSDELMPLEKLIEIFLVSNPDEKKIYNELTEEILIHCLLDFCAFLYEEKIKEVGNEFVPRFFD